MEELKPKAPEMASAPCPQCGHERRVHGKNGCTVCKCPATYMDLSTAPQ